MNTDGDDLRNGSRWPDDTRQVAVIGPGAASPREETDAEQVGFGVAALGATVVTGGLGGVMAAAARGARRAGGRTVGLLPGVDPAAANSWIDIVIPTGLGEARNALVVRSAAVVVAIGHGWGTLSEVALALRAGLPVVCLHSWAPVPPDGAAGTPAGRLLPVDDPAEAVHAVQAALFRNNR